MKQKQRIALFGIVAVALIFAACDGDSGNNSTEPEGDSSSSTGIYSSSEQINSSSVVRSSSSSAGVSGSSVVASSSSVKVLSSASTPLSSSVGESSSSSVTICSNTYGTNTVTDCRDNQTYETVLIGTQTWMAENLNYAVDSSWCYENSADSCAKYGRLYTWTAAMNIDSSYQDAEASAVISSTQQGACPVGWHIPTDGEWTTLENAVGGSSVAGTKLKSTGGWDDDGNGTDAYGFSALPAGYRGYRGDFHYVGSYAYFWSASELATGYAYYWELYYGLENMGTYGYSEDNAFSVRCLKDLV